MSNILITRVAVPFMFVFMIIEGAKNFDDYRNVLPICCKF